MGKFAIGSMMGFMLGAGLMLTPSGTGIRRDMRKKKNAMKHWIRQL